MIDRAAKDRATEVDPADAIARVRQGSATALAQIYDWHNRRVRQLARRLLGDDAAAEDLVQEIFERLPAALKRFRDEANLETLLFSMVLNHARVAFVLCQVQELTSSEAAALAGVPETTMRTRLFHARRQLRLLMPRETEQ